MSKEMLEILKEVKKFALIRIEKTKHLKHELEREIFLCSISYNETPYDYKEFTSYLHGNHDSENFVMFDNNKKRIEWLDKHIKLNS